MLETLWTMKAVFLSKTTLFCILKKKNTRFCGIKLFDIFGIFSAYISNRNTTYLGDVW